MELIRAEHPDAVDELERLLGEERYDVELIYPILERIKDSPSATTIRDAIIEELMGAGTRLRLAVFGHQMGGRGAVLSRGRASPGEMERLRRPDRRPRPPALRGGKRLVQARPARRDIL